MSISFGSIERLERVDEELADRDLALAASSSSGPRWRPSASITEPRSPDGSAVGERAADRAEVPHERVGDLRRGRRDRRVARADQVGRREMVVPDQRADPQDRRRAPRSPSRPSIRLMSTSCAGRREPELHHRDQALSAGEHLGVVAVRGEETERLVSVAGRWYSKLDGSIGGLSLRRPRGVAVQPTASIRLSHGSAERATRSVSDGRLGQRASVPGAGGRGSGPAAP